MTDEIQKLILDVQGRDKVEALNAELVKEQQALAKLSADLRTGATSQATFEAAAQSSAAKIIALNQQLGDTRSKLAAMGPAVLTTSYAVQDFTSVLSGGQGLARALGSVQNNIPGLLMNLGVSGGLAGVVSLVSVGIGALIPLVEQLWGAFDDKEKIKAAQERLREFKEQVDETHRAFMDLANAPTTPEQQSAEGIGLFLRERPNAEKTRAAVAAALPRNEVLASLPGDVRLGLATAEANAAESDESIGRRARQAAREEFARMGGEGEPPDELVESHRGQFTKAREAARQQAASVMSSARRNKAESIVTGATVAGPAGAANRGRLFDLTRGNPAFKELQYYTPEAIEAAEAAAQAEDEAGGPGTPAFAERARKGAAGRRKTARLIDALNQQGRDNKEAGDREAQHQLEQQRREVDDELRENQAVDAQNLHDWRQGQQTAPMRRARAIAVKTAADMGFKGPTAPTSDQADDLARRTMQHMEEGLSAQAAAQMAVMDKMKAIAGAMQRWSQAQEAHATEAMRLQFGTDQNGAQNQFPGIW